MQNIVSIPEPRKVESTLRRPLSLGWMARRRRKMPGVINRLQTFTKASGRSMVNDAMHLKKKGVNITPPNRSSGPLIFQRACSRRREGGVGVVVVRPELGLMDGRNRCRWRRCGGGGGGDGERGDGGGKAVVENNFCARCALLTLRPSRRAAVSTFPTSFVDICSPPEPIE